MARGGVRRAALPLVTSGLLAAYAACRCDARGGREIGRSRRPPAADRNPIADVRFPLHIAASGGHLVDSSGHPFLIHGDAPWDLVTTPTTAEAEAYLDARRAQGVNTLVVQLLEHHSWPNVPPHAPKLVDGTAPFLRAGDFSTPNPAYFAHAHDVVEAARARGMLVLLAPAYMGYPDTDEGWWREMSRAEPAACEAYGDFLARRFSDLNDVIWMHGGDRLPATGSSGEACALAVARPLMAISGSLHTAHWNTVPPDNGSFDEPAFAPFVQLDAVYTYGFAYERCAVERSRHPRAPAFLVETQYEGEHGTRPFEFRRQAYWADLACGAGQVAGNLPIWSFARGWRHALDSQGARDLVHLRALLEPRRWYDLRPDDEHRIVTSGYGSRGGPDYVVTAATADGQLAIGYVPSAGSGRRAMTIDFGRFSVPVVLRWFDPTTGAFHADVTASAHDAPRRVETPGDHSSGENDWAFVIETP